MTTKLENARKALISVLIVLLAIPFAFATTQVYTYNATYENINMFAKECDGNSTALDTPANLPFPGCSYNDITSQSGLDSNDSSYVVTAGTYIGWHDFYANISIDVNKTTKLTWTWDGYGYSVSGYSARLFLYNFSGSNWLQCGSIGDVVSGSLQCSIDSVNTNISNFFNSSNMTHLLVYANTTGTPGSYKRVGTDFVRLDIDYGFLTINSPSSNQETINTLSLTINTTQSDSYNNSVWYTWNGGLQNNTLCTGSTRCQDIITLPRQGYYNLTFYANSSNNEIVSENITNIRFVNRTQHFLNESGFYDTYIENSNPIYNNYDSSVEMRMENQTHGYIDKELIKFNLSNYLNKNISIINSTLYTFYYASASNYLFNLFFYRVNGYYESNVTTWVNMNSTQNWTVQGGDYTINDNSSCQLYALENGFCSMNSSWFQGWIDGTLNDYGILIYTSNTATTLRRHSANTTNSSKMPYLNLTYFSPPSEESNIPPTVTAVLANNTNYTSTQFINLTFNITDDNDYIKNISLWINDSRYSTSYYNKWVNVSLNTTLNFSPVLAGGNYTWFIESYDSDGISANTTKLSIHINSVPIVNTPNLNNSLPADTDDILCNATIFSDYDGDPIFLFYNWYKNSVPMYINISYLRNENTSNGELWYCSVTPYDGIENGTTKTSETVSIGTGFAPPSIVRTNATTNTSYIISDSTNPTRNDSWVNLTVEFTDINSDGWTAYFCSSTAHSLAGCTDTTYCISDINSTSKKLSCNHSAASMPETSYTYYVFVKDSTNLSTASTSGTFDINHPPLKPTILEPVVNKSINSTIVNFTAEDSDSDVLNFTVYNSTDNVTWTELAVVNYSGYNWTSLKDGIYYLKAIANDYHNYIGVSNSSSYHFRIDTNASKINSISASANSIYTSESVTLTLNSTDLTTAVSSCLFSVKHTTYNFGNGAGALYNYSTTKSGDLFTATISGAIGSGNLELDYVFCNDSVGNMASNESTLLVSITVATSSAPPSGGGTQGECMVSSDCTKFGVGYICLFQKCVLNSSYLPKAFTACNYNGLCESDRGESWFNCRCDQEFGCGLQEEESGDCLFSFTNLFSKQAGRPSAAKFLVWITGISIGLFILFIIMKYLANKKKKSFRRF